MYTFANKSQSTSAVCCVLLELSTLYLLQRASKRTGEPGNLSLASDSVSTLSSLLIFFYPTKASSLFKCDKSNSALWITSLLFPIKLRKSSTTSENFFCLDKNSSVYP